MLKYILIGGLLLVGSVSGGYLFDRHVASNMNRELDLNSANRETASVINFGKELEACESNDALLKKLQFDLQTKTQGSNDWTMTVQNIHGVQLAKTQCLSSLQTIIDTTDIESFPQFPALNARYQVLKND